MRVIIAIALLVAGSGAWSAECPSFSPFPPGSPTKCDLNQLNNNEVADADEVMENFNRLADAIDDKTEQLTAFPVDASGRTLVEVDCDNDSSAFQTAYEKTRAVPRLQYQISGICDFNYGFSFINQDVVIQGDCSSSNGGFRQIYGSGPTLESARGGGLSLNCLTLEPDTEWWVKGGISAFRVSADNSSVFLASIKGGEALDVFVNNGGQLVSYATALSVVSVGGGSSATFGLSGETQIDYLKVALLSSVQVLGNQQTALIGRIYLSDQSVARFLYSSQFKINDLSADRGSHITITSESAISNERIDADSRIYRID